MLVFSAVLPSPKRSKAMPRRGFRSFQLSTVPVQPFVRLFMPSEHAGNVIAGASALAGSDSGSDWPMNQSKRSPALIVARRIVQRSCAYRPVSALIALRRSVGSCSVVETGAPALYLIGWTFPVYCCRSRHRPSLTVAPNLKECDPVTYEAEPDSVNS